jgi:hypothetical protein
MRDRVIRLADIARAERFYREFLRQAGGIQEFERSCRKLVRWKRASSGNPRVPRRASGASYQEGRKRYS